MPGFLVNMSSTVTCAHTGRATPSVPNPRVMADSQPTVLLSTPWVVTGCAMPPPTGGNGPDIMGQMLVGTTRVFSNGQPLVVQSSSSVAAATGIPLMILVTQVRVSAQ